jgi:hypothetical protein
MSGKACAKPTAATVQARPHAADWHAGQVGDLLVFAPLDIGEIHDEPVPVRQRPHRCHDAGVDHGANHAVFGRPCTNISLLQRHAPFSGIPGQQQCLAPLPSVTADERVDHDAMQPCTQVCAGLEATGRRDRLRERFLDQVFRVGLVAGQTQS